MADQSKLDKLKKLRELGINPYPYSFNQTHHAEEIRTNYGKLEVVKLPRFYFLRSACRLLRSDRR